MEVLEKKVVKLGNSGGIIVDSYMTFGSGIKVGDIVSIKCQTNKIIITKKNKGE
jgi:hypothetical protein